MDHHVEVVRGGASTAQADELVAFWTRHGALSDTDARARVPEVVGVLRDGDGEIVGASSVYEERVPLIADRLFHMCRRFVAPGVTDAGEALLLNTVFDTLDAEHGATDHERDWAAHPAGICVMADAAALRRDPRAVWSDTGLLHAGFLADGRSLRIRYYAGALVTEPDPGRRREYPPGDGWMEEFPLGDEYEVHLFADTDVVTADDVIAMWAREGAVEGAEGPRRVQELLMVATHPRDGVVGAMTTYLQRNQQLRTDVWYARAFVSEAHRRSNVVRHMTLRGHEHLIEQFVTGQDTRGAGIAADVENESMKRYFPEAAFPFDAGFFIGRNRRNDHTYLRYFPGATIDAP